MASCEPTPAGAGRRPAFGLLREVLLYLAAAALAVLLVHRVLRLEQADLRVPLSMQGDGVYYGLLIKTLIETGWVHHNPSLSAPFGLDFYDFPHFDNLHLAIMKLLALARPDWAVVANLFYLLTFPLTALTTLFLLRRLKLHGALGLAIALLYAFQPYHFLRTQGHIMLASYYLLPLQLLLCFWLSEGRVLRRAGEKSGRLLGSGRFWAAVAICLAASSAGHYYALFGCLFFAVSGGTASLRHRRWRNARHALLLCGVTVVGLAVNLLPNTLYWAAHGPNRQCSAKQPQFSEQFGLKVTQMLLPVSSHRIKPLADLGARYEETAPNINENRCSAVGLVAGVGFLLLVGLAFVPGRPGPADSPLRLLSRLNLAGVLLATVGGFGTLLAYVVTPQLHGYNRMSIFLALFGLTAVACLLDWAVRRVSRPWLRHAAALAAAGLVLAWGLYDQVTPAYIPSYAANKAAFERHAAFGRALERAVPPGTMIFALPLSNFPFDNGQIGYDHFHLYLHTHGLKWSDPAMLNRRPQMWHEAVAALPPERMLEALVCAGFRGLLLDRKLHRPQDDQLFRRVAELTGVPPLHDGGTRYFFDLRKYADSCRSRYRPEQWQRRQEQVFSFVTAVWGPQFTPRESGPGGPWKAWRWCWGPRGELTLINPSDGPVRVALRMTLYPYRVAPMPLSVASRFFSGAWLIPPQGTKISQAITVPPGEHHVVFTSGASPEQVPGGDPWFRVESFSLHGGGLVGEDQLAGPPARP